MATVDYRARLGQLMQATLADESARHDWTYDAVRPLATPARPWKAGMRVVGDCSKGVQWLCWWAETPADPMGRGWDGYGNSQTLWAHLQHLGSPGDLLVGDIVTFGVDGEEHAAMVLARGSDPLLWSFGHQGAPNTYRLSQDGRPKQYLRNPLPAYVPTPVERLRARAGWFAWVAWRLGEGDWQPYGRSNRKVRPHVPTLIPLSWWRRYAAFIARRKRGNP